ncbi:hypothetical protein [Nitritalea halalkaliphila]|nr:hypothetical protein [Nitritalea halalkaliphila]
MKKTGYFILLAFWLVMQAVEARAHTFEAAAAADSVIIQYRNSGRVAVAIPEETDREALKNMSINELFRALNLDEKSLSDLDNVNFTPAEGGEAPMFGVKETPGVTEVRVGGIVVTVDETKGNTQVNVVRRRHREPAFRTYFHVDFGINSFLDEDGGFVSSQEDFSTRGWGSWNLGLNWWASQRLVRGLNLNASLGAQLMRFNFDSRNTQVVRGLMGWSSFNART